MRGRIAVAVMLLAISIVTAALALINHGASAEEDAPDIDVQVRISAQRSADGSVRFGLRVRGTSGEWTEPVTPRSDRFNPASVNAGRWLVSSALALEVDESGRGRLVRSELFEPASASDAAHVAVRG